MSNEQINNTIQSEQTPTTVQDIPSTGYDIKNQTTQNKVTPADSPKIRQTEGFEALTMASFLKSLSDTTDSSSEVWLSDHSQSKRSQLITADAVIRQLVDGKENLMRSMGTDTNFESLIRLLTTALSAGDIAGRPGVAVLANGIKNKLFHTDVTPGDVSFIQSDHSLPISKALTKVTFRDGALANSILTSMFTDEIAADSSSYIRGQGTTLNYVKLKHHESEIVEHRRVFARTAASRTSRYLSFLTEALGAMRGSYIRRLARELDDFGPSAAHIARAKVAFTSVIPDEEITYEMMVGIFEPEDEVTNSKGGDKNNKKEETQQKKKNINKRKPTAILESIPVEENKTPLITFVNERDFLAATLTTEAVDVGLPLGFFGSGGAYEFSSRFITFIDAEQAQNKTFILGLMSLLFSDKVLTPHSRDHAGRVKVGRYDQIVIVVRGAQTSLSMGETDVPLNAWVKAKDLFDACFDLLRADMEPSISFSSKGDVANAISFWAGNMVQYIREANEVEKTTDTILGLPDSKRVFKWWECIARRAEDEGVEHQSEVTIDTCSFWAKWAYQTGYLEYAGSTVSGRVNFSPTLLLEVARPYSALMGSMVDSLASANGIPMGAYSLDAQAEGSKNQLLGTLVSRMTKWTVWSVADGELVRSVGSTIGGRPSMPSGWTGYQKNVVSRAYATSFTKRADQNAASKWQCFSRTWWAGACASVAGWTRDHGFAMDEELSVRFGQEKENGMFVDSGYVLKPESSKRLISDHAISAVFCSPHQGKSSVKFFASATQDEVYVVGTSMEVGGVRCVLPVRVPVKSKGRELGYSLSDLAEEDDHWWRLRSVNVIVGAGASDGILSSDAPICDLDLDFA